MNNKNYSRAKVLTLIPVIIFVVIALSLVLSTILEGPTARGTVYTVFAFIGVVGLFLAPLPCLIVSILGTMFAAKAKKEGVAQSGTFNPYTTVPAATMCSSRNMIVSSRQTIYPLENGAYVCIKGVDFSKSGARVVLNVAEGHKGGTVEFRAGNFANGELLAAVKVGQKTSASAELTMPAEKVTDLYIVINGDVELVNWGIQ